MFDVFKYYISNKLPLSDYQFEQIIPFLHKRTLHRGEVLLRAGEVCRHTTFVERGCLRSYVTDEKGKEHIINFAPENWWIADQNSVKNHVPAMFNIEAIEDSEVVLMPGDIPDRLEKIVPGAIKMFTTLSQNSMFALQKRLVNLLSATADDRYHDFLETYPSLALRLPQKMIASYIGVAPESLSRIRSQIVIKK
jgi:CRP-like cAMP-binding protein